MYPFSIQSLCNRRKTVAIGIHGEDPLYDGSFNFIELQLYTAHCGASVFACAGWVFDGDVAIAETLSAGLQHRLQELRDQADSAADGVAALQAKRQELKMKVDNVTEAIAAIGHSPNLLSKLAAIEAEISRLDDRLAEMNQPRDLTVSLDDLRMFLHERAAAIGELLHGDVEIARQALAKHVDQLVLTPKGTPDGPILEVSGDVEIFDGNGATGDVCSSNGGQRRDRVPLHALVSRETDFAGPAEAPCVRVA